MIISTDVHHTPPRVDLSISDLPAATTELVVTRVVGRDEWRVRRPGAILAATTAYLEDPEVPTGVPVTYQLLALGSDGAELDRESTVVDPLPDAPSGSVWLSDPLDAASAVLATVLDGTTPEQTFPVDIVHTVPVGMSLGITSRGMRHVAGPMPFRMLGHTAADFNALDAILRNATEILIRPQSWKRMPPLIYGVPQELSLGSIFRAGIDWSMWSFTIQPDIGPGLDLLLPRRTWADLMAECSTWGASDDSVMDTYPTWRDALRGPV